MQLDPIVGVTNVSASSDWYRSVLGCKELHGGDEFSVLANDDGVVILCLHKWGEHHHPTLTNPSDDPSNGLILYFRTNNLDDVYHRAVESGHAPETEIELNENSRRREFSIRDPDGYYATISEYHEYQG